MIHDSSSQVGLLEFWYFKNVLQIEDRFHKSLKMKVLSGIFTAESGRKTVALTPFF